MVEMLEAVASWQSLLMVLLVFGVAPGLVLRLIVRIYPKDDPRRRELVAELYVQNRFERPLWVAEQFETALSEGAAQRLRDVRDRRRARKESKKQEVDDPLFGLIDAEGRDVPIKRTQTNMVRAYQRKDGMRVPARYVRTRRKGFKLKRRKR